MKSPADLEQQCSYVPIEIFTHAFGSSLKQVCSVPSAQWVFFMLDWNSLQHREDNNLSIFLIFNEATWNLKFSFHKQPEKGRNQAQQKASALY